MTIFVSGLLLFFGVHLVTLTPVLRRRAVGLMGEIPWRCLVAMLALGGMALLGIGWQGASAAPLFAANAEVIRFAPVSVTLALILIVIGGGNLRGHIRRRLQHPMLIGTALWSVTHLLANGGLRETMLFGAFLVFALYALGVLLLREQRATFEPHWKWDVAGILLGLVAAAGFLHGHQWLFGVAVR